MEFMGFFEVLGGVVAIAVVGIVRFFAVEIFIFLVENFFMGLWYVGKGFVKIVMRGCHTLKKLLLMSNGALKKLFFDNSRKIG